ncbi:thiamine pyrophosphate-dependent dehydrogenase E1 component subunit alpha [Luteolibacter sp. LG18]|uniref:thiamine pyrophosphate-dependent dehydrogenase E1 component subunit alpha n=1 Tax=Luteolibacter sp. LG18 TaxID=2819286 RepID=UPI002B2D1A19|nr:pyruvate dehydrogenase E1 component subunit alpha [Luteolibacter sp. LG18]
MNSPFADSAVNLALTREEKVDIYRLMVRTRRLEQAAILEYSAGQMGGWLSVQIGQESIAAGVRSLLGPGDHVIAGYRAIGHAVASGMSMEACLAELFGKASGCAKGKGGMMGMFHPAGRFWGGYSVAAAQTPLAAGLAFALKLRDEKGAVCCFLGDGAVNQGCFHEALNLAGLFDLPVIYIIENNGFGMWTSVKRASAYRDCLAKRAEGYAIDWDLIHGDDLYEIRAKTHVALQRVYRDGRPTVLEIATYRFYGQSIADANQRLYRTVEEIEERKLHHDPVVIWRDQLISEGVLDEELAQRISDEAKAESVAARAFAREADAPRLEDITRDVYWESDHDTPASRVGWHFFDA